MTAVVPDPRFRDQLAEARPLTDRFAKELHEHADDCICDRWVVHHSQMLAVIANQIISAEVEARVQAAADQRAGGPLRCTYCGGYLTIYCEYVGPAYLSENRPESIECGACDATWEPDGTPRDAAKWVRYPDLYAPPALAQPAPGGEPT